MNISQTQMLTRLRTWTLVAGLTALVIAPDAGIGGVFAWLFAAIAVGANRIGRIGEKSSPANHSTRSPGRFRARRDTPQLATERRGGASLPVAP
jgi:hypothetical protein